MGATFAYAAADDGLLQATAVPGSYRMLFRETPCSPTSIGIPTEIIGITPEGIVVAKQTFGQALPEKVRSIRTSTRAADPASPPAFSGADRDHPRLVFLDDEPWLVADTHDRNVVIAEDGSRRIIDLVAAPLPQEWLDEQSLFRDWIERARLDPRAEILAPANDDEL